MYIERQRWEVDLRSLATAKVYSPGLGSTVRPLLLLFTSSDSSPSHLISFSCTQYSLAQAILAARGLEFTSPFNTNRKQDGENREGSGELNKEKQRFSNNLRDHHWSPGSGKTNLC